MINFKNNNSYFKIFLLLTILYLSFQTKPWTNIVGEIYAGDDNSYYGYVSSIVNDFDFDFSNNKVIGTGEISPITGRIVSLHSIGTSVLLIPFYIAVKPLVLISDWIANTPFNQRHSFFFMFMCGGILLYTYMGGYFLYKACLLLNFEKQISLISVIAIIWGTILPVYIFKRPIFPCIPEFFLISLFLYFIVKWRVYKNVELKHVFILGLAGGGILITRWNDFNIILFAMYFLFLQSSQLSKPIKTIFKILLFSTVVFLVFFFTQSLAWKFFLGSYFKLPYNPLTVVKQAPNYLSIPSALLHVFIGLDWGIVYTMLPFTIGLVSFLWLDPLRVSKIYYLDKIVYCLLLLSPFIIILNYKQQGSYYGYRNLLSSLPFACLGLAAFLGRIYGKFPNSLKYLKFCLLAIVIFNFFLILPFEYNQSTSLEPGYSILGGGGWVNDSYVLNAIRIYFISPVKDLIGLFMRGFAGGYIFCGIYLFFPDIFLKVAGANQKIASYYTINSYDRWIAMLYPVFVGLLLIIFQSIFKKSRLFKTS